MKWSTPGIPTTKKRTIGPTGLSSMFCDFRNQMSWGRICAAVALVVAVWREFTGATIQHVALWLVAATGSYGTSKLTEIVAILKNVGVAAPPAFGSTPAPASDGVSIGAKIEATHEGEAP